MYKLKTQFTDVFQKDIDGCIHVRGKLDEVYVNDDGSISVLEFKTTGKPYLTNAEIQAATFQLQMYVWMYKETFEGLGYKMNDSHYLLIYSQKDGHLMRTVVVQEDPEIETCIRYILNIFLGLAPSIIPKYYICKRCPVQVKKVCDWYEKRKVVKD